MQAIITKFIPATNTLGARIKATAYRGSVTVGYDHGESADENHKRAAMKLAAKLGWPEEGWTGGDMPDGRGSAFVLSD